MPHLITHIEAAHTIDASENTDRDCPCLIPSTGFLDPCVFPPSSFHTGPIVDYIACIKHTFFMLV